MRRALFVLYYFPPSGGPGVQRGLKFIRYLPEFGWQPVVLTARETAQYQARDESLLDEVPAGLIVRRTRCPEFYGLYRRLTGQSRDASLDVTGLDQRRRGPLQQVLRDLRGAFFIPDGRIAWFPFAVRAGRRLIREQAIDLIFSSGPPFTCHLIARALARESRLPWIADYRDPWTQATFYPPRPAWAREIDLSLEASCVRGARATIVVGEGMAAEFRARYPDVPADRFRVIPNGFDEADFAATEYERPDVFRITHAGSVFPGRSPNTLLSALAALIAASPDFARSARLTFAGRLDETFRRALQAPPIDRILELPGYLKHADSIRLLRRSALLLLLLGTDAQARSMVTGKVFEYLASGVPIVALGPTDGDAARLLARCGAGWIFDPADANGIRTLIARAWREFRNGGAAGAAEPLRYGLRRDEAAIHGFARRSLTGDLARLFDSVH